MIRRREFITLLGGAAAAWPLMARAQQGNRVRRIGVNEPVWKNRLSALTKALADLGWTDGRNVRMDLRWVGADINRIRALAQESIRQDDKPAPRLTPKCDDGRFDLCIAVNRRSNWHELE